MDEITPHPRTHQTRSRRGVEPDTTPRATAPAAAAPPGGEWPDADLPENDDGAPQDRPTLHLDRPAEVLAWLPYQVKFWPQESAVLLSLRRTDPPPGAADADTDGLQPGLIARTDLAVIGGMPHGRAAQVEMGRHLERDGAHRALCAIYTDQSFASVLRGQGRAGRTLAWWRTTPWAELGKTYVIGPERFRCVDCADEPCCPHTGQPLDVLDNTESAAWHVFHGHGYVRERRLLVPDSRASTERRRAATAAARRHYGQRSDLPGEIRSTWHREMEQRWVAVVAASARAEGTGGTRPAGVSGEYEEPSPEDLGAVLAGLADPRVRDSALLWSGTGKLLGDAVRDNMIDAVFSGRLVPQRRRLRQADHALAVLEAHATDRWKAPVLTSRAWLAWWSGEGAKANILLERTMQIDPHYSLAQLLGTALAHGIPPGWARNRGFAS